MRLKSFHPFNFLVVGFFLFSLPAPSSKAATSPSAEEFSAWVQKPRTSDFDPQSGYRHLRALVVVNQTHYFLDGGDQRGLTYDMMKRFEDFLNQKFASKKALRFKIVFIPVRRDQLIPYLLEGRGDIAAAGLTITPARKKQVQFADPWIRTINEIPVAKKNGVDLKSLSDLSGREIWVRPSSSYHESLKALNVHLKAEGKEPVRIRLADELLEDEDLLKSVDAGLLPMTIVDHYLATFWSQVLTEMKTYPEIKLRSNGEIAWAVRPKNPRLLSLINEFVKSNKIGTLHGNILRNQYLKDSSRLQNVLDPEKLARLSSMKQAFQTYAKDYKIDWMLLAAQGYQESKLNQDLRSPRGAVGVMQLLPSTAAGPEIQIPDIEILENNIHAGVKYLSWIAGDYFDDPELDPLNRWFFSFAAYNAGPARVQGLRKKAKAQGYDPNRWFQNVEIIAAREIGRETVDYVSHIYQYYLAYQSVAALTQARSQLQAG